MKAFPVQPVTCSSSMNCWLHNANYVSERSLCPVLTIFFLYIINCIYYKVLKTLMCFNEAEPTLEFNSSMFLIIAALSFKSPRDHSNSQIASSNSNAQEGRYPTGTVRQESTLRGQYGSRSSRQRFFRW